MGVEWRLDTLSQAVLHSTLHTLHTPTLSTLPKLHSLHTIAPHSTLKLSPLSILQSRCHSNLWRCPSVQSVGSLSMLQRRSLQEDTSGTQGASSVQCVTRCWTAPAVTRRIIACTARRVTAVDTVPRDTGSGVDLELSIWILEYSSETRSSRTTNPWTPH